MKRRTLILDEQRLRELKRLAAERGQTLSAIVDEFLSDGLRRASAPKETGVRLPVFPMGEPRVNLAVRDQLWEVMDET